MLESEKPVDTIAADATVQPALPALAVPDKPSIAVLPFQNLSGDPEQEYFADGMTEDVTTLLSQTRDFLVIARGSTLAYKAGSVDIDAIGRQLGVRYILEGSVRKSASKICVTAQLVEARTSVRVWGDHFDRELTELFAVQDDITSGIVGALHPQLFSAEAQSYRRQPPNSLDAWGLAVRGMMALVSLTKENLDTAVDLGSLIDQDRSRFWVGLRPQGIRVGATEPIRSGARIGMRTQKGHQPTSIVPSGFKTTIRPRSFSLAAHPTSWRRHRASVGRP